MLLINDNFFIYFGVKFISKVLTSFLGENAKSEYEYLILESFRQCSILESFRTDSAVFWNRSDSAVFFVFHFTTYLDYNENVFEDLFAFC